MDPVIAEADEAQFAACLALLRQLRPALGDGALEQIRRQYALGYRLALLTVAGEPLACAGFRVVEALSCGRYLQIDDFVTDEAHRSQGLGDLLFDWLVERAEALDCAMIQLDSSVQRTSAHRFYFRKAMFISSFRFRRVLP